MRYFSVLILIMILGGTTSAQYEIGIRMGIDFINSPSVVDYINQNFSTPGERLPDFNSAVVFSVEGGYNLNESYQIAIEGGYLINSYTKTTLVGKYELSYNIIMPSVMNYYVMAGNGYNFKFGGGAGLRFVNVKQRPSGLDVYETYTSTGFGFILKAQGNTLLGDNFYANISAQIRYDINGEPENEAGPLYDGFSKNVNFNSLSAGVSLGVTYIF